jgi:hypothetical protein
MTDALTEAQEAKVAEVVAHADPAERYAAAREARARNRETYDRRLQEIQKEAVRELRPGRTWAEVGKLIGTTGSWAEALVSDRKPRRQGEDHGAESTPRASAVEGHSPDTEEPESQ